VPAKKAPAPANTTKKPGQEDEDLGPIMQVSDKQKRMNEERALKTLKWNFDVPRKEFVEQLRNQIEAAGFNKILTTQLFHDDFKIQQTALATLTRAITECSEAVISNLDLILRWLSLRFFETNPTVMLKAIEFQLSLFTMVIESRTHLSDFEANGFIPYFIGKLGDRQDSIRKGFRQIIKLLAQCYPPAKLFNLLIQGLASKNARQRTECLEELGMMIEAIGLNSFNPAVTIKEIAKQISDRDNGVRSAALNTITIAYQIVGDQVYKYIGKLPEKEMSYLEERIKRSAKAVPGGVRPSGGPVGNGRDTGSAVNPSMPSSNSLPAMGKKKNQENEMPELPVGRNNLINGMVGVSENGGFVLNGSMPKNATPKRFQTLTKPPPKGEFSLELNDDDDDRNGDIQIKLTAHKDLDELLNQPVQMPPPRTNVHSYPIK